MVQTSIISNRPAKKFAVRVCVLCRGFSFEVYAIKERVKGFCVIHRIIESNAFGGGLGFGLVGSKCDCTGNVVDNNYAGGVLCGDRK